VRFCRNKNALGTPILRSGYNLVRYHLGSVALGSFLIAVVQFARVVLKCAEKYLHSHRGKCVDCALKCCQCCLYCFEKILKYMSRNAYIEIGKTFLVKESEPSFSVFSHVRILLLSSWTPSV
jgi:solute carrier family 44 protein 1 (choline transporter-like protein)